MKSILIGSVTSSEIVLEEMLKTGFPVDMVFSLDEQYSENVSGYFPIHETARANNIPYKKFRKINDEENIEIIKKISPDYIFVIGLSQLIKKEIISAAKRGVVGFHPAALPKFRGRATLVWQMLLKVKEPKCSMFLIDEGTDSGDILAQEPFHIGEEDYAEDVMKNLEDSIAKMAHGLLPKLMNNTVVPVKQNDAEATYTLIRRPEDGKINWNDGIDNIHLLLRAVSRPYPGAFSNYDGEHKFIFWRAERMKNDKFIGIPGQICGIGENYIDILCTDGILHVTEYENTDNVKTFAGHKFY